MIKSRVLDKHLVEVKIENKKIFEEQNLKCYFFIPKSLDINEYTYPKEIFHRHLHNEIYLHS